ANKSNRLSGEIEQSKQELERQQERLSRIEGQISKKEQEAKAEKERAEQTAIPGAAPVVVSDQDLSKFISGSKEIGFKTVQELVDGIRFTYSDISIECGNKYAYAFIPGDENTDDFKRVKNECVAAGGEDFVKIETKNITKPDGNQSVDIYQCKAEWNCDTAQAASLANAVTKREALTTIDLKPKSAGVLNNDNLYPDKLQMYEIPKVKSDVTIAEKDITPVIEDNKDMTLQQGTEPRQVNDSGNRDGQANRLLAESILEQKCNDGVEKNPLPLIFEYYCVGITERECEELKTAFESADLPAQDVEFKAEIEEQLFPSGTRTIKNVCVVYLI
ncbi:MAG: hypothetical protein IJQ90_00680, partial [Alphaproteobacteria bacterium]|nr:hypothetical protein [Alphaproteobacteria bacterium]